MFTGSNKYSKLYEDQNISSSVELLEESSPVNAVKSSSSLNSSNTTSSCKKGCCKKDSSLLIVEQTTSEVQSSDSLPLNSDGACKKGCCKKNSLPKECKKVATVESSTKSCCSSGKCTKSNSISSQKSATDPNTCKKEETNLVEIPSKQSCCSSGTCSKTQPQLKQVEDCCKSGSCKAPVNHQHSNKLSTIDIDSSHKLLKLNVRKLHCADCANMVEEVLMKKKGVLNARVNSMTDSAQIAHDPELISDRDIVELISELGFPTTVATGSSSENHDQEFLTVSFKFNQTLESGSFSRVKEAIKKQEGVLSMSSIPEEGLLNVDYNPNLTGTRTLKKLIESDDSSHSFSIINGSMNDSKTDENNRNEMLTWRRNLLVCFTLSIPVIITSFILSMIPVVNEFLKTEIIQGINYYTIIGFIFATPIQLYFGKPMYISAYRALRYARKPNMDCLVMLSTTTAYVYSLVSTIVAIFVDDYEAEAFFDASALLLTFIILGRFLEILAKGQTSAILTSILKLRCTRATIIYKQNYQSISCQSELESNEDGLQIEEEEIDIDLVQRGDILKVKPGNKIPTDGVVFYGSSSVDEAMISGESIPVFKNVGDQVFGSTINQFGTIFVRVTKTSSENTLSAIDKLIHESQNAKIPIQRIADTVSAYFVPIILIISFSVFILWLSLCYAGVLTTNLHPVTFALQFALAILVISCPCAISLAAPTAIMVGSAVSVKQGILFKSGKVIENCHKVNTIIFDKTGTLTNGKPVMTDCIVFDKKINESTFKSIIGSAELGSEHVLGKAIVSHLEKEDIAMEQPLQYVAEPGKGLVCSVFGRRVLAGNTSWMADNAIRIDFSQTETIQQLEMEGKTVILVSCDGELTGVVALSDTPKSEATLVVNELKKRGIEIWVVSGDNVTTTTSIANQLGIENIMGGVLPAKKKDKVQELQSNPSLETGHKRVVAMIGDGINDSPSLAQADVGFAIGAGSDIALETADVILVKSDLKDVLVALDISKTTFRRIKINFAWAFLYNIIGIPIAAGALYPALGFSIPPAIAGLSEIFSSIPVILFSLLLKFYKPTKY